MSATLITTTRTIGQMRATLARVALARQRNRRRPRRLGPDRPWGLADPLTGSAARDSAQRGAPARAAADCEAPPQRCHRSAKLCV